MYIYAEFQTTVIAGNWVAGDLARRGFHQEDK